MEEMKKQGAGNNEVLRFMLTDYYDTVTAMMLGELYRHNGEWKFAALGEGTNHVRLSDMVADYR